VGSADSVWGIDAQQQVFHFDTQTQAWNLFPVALTQIAWALTAPCGGSTRPRNFLLQSAGTKLESSSRFAHPDCGRLGNAVWGVNAQQQVYHYNPQGQVWELIPDQLTQVSAAFDGTVWGISSAQEVFTFDSQTQVFAQVSGSLSQIAVGSNGAVWGTNSSEDIFRAVMASSQTQ
jgi:virginiamycin B lyase